MNRASYLPAIQACGEHEHVIVALKAGLHHSGKITTLLARLVNSDTHRLQPREVEKQVIDEIAELPVIAFSNEGTQRNAVLTAQRVVGNNGIELSVVLIGQILHALNRQFHLQIVHATLQPFRSLYVPRVPKKLIDLIFVGDLPKPTNGKTWHKPCLAAHFAR